MKVQADTEVAVLSARTDLDLAISTWLPGYVAQRTDDLDTVMDVTRRGGVVLIDLGSPRHEEWVAGLRERGFDGPTVYLEPQGDMTIDLRERVVVPSPPSLSELLTGFEVARSHGRRPRRRSDRDAEPPAPKRHHRRTRVEPTGDADAARPPEVEEGAGDLRRARRVDRGRRQEAQASPSRERRVDRRQHQEPVRSVSRGRRVDRRPAPQGRSFWRSLQRRVGLAGSSPTDATDAVATPAPARIPADAEREFRKLFHAAEEQPDFQRRVETPEGRVRVQTDEELFAGHSAAPASAEIGTAVTAPRPRRRRTRVGA